jgi:hypothetical protein
MPETPPEGETSVTDFARLAQESAERADASQARANFSGNPELATLYHTMPKRAAVIISDGKVV